MRRVVALACAGLLLGAPALAESGEPPAAARSMRLIVPFAPGGSNDTLARLVAEPLGRRLGQAVSVENRAGAGGLIANEACARAAPDGLTLCLGTAPTHSVLPHQMPGRMGTDPADFTPITRIGHEVGVMAVNRTHAAAEFRGFLDWAALQPTVPFGISGTSSLNYLMMLQLARATGLRLEPVVYRGGALTQTALIAGEVPVGAGLLSSFAGALRAGEMRALLVLGPTRSAILPDVPSLNEALRQHVGVATYVGIFGPAGMAPRLSARIHAALAESLQLPALRARAAAMGVDIDLLGPADFAAWLRDTAPDWAAIALLGAGEAEPNPPPASPMARP